MRWVERARAAGRRCLPAVAVVEVSLTHLVASLSG